MLINTLLISNTAKCSYLFQPQIQSQMVPIENIFAQQSSLLYKTSTKNIYIHISYKWKTYSTMTTINSRTNKITLVIQDKTKTNRCKCWQKTCIPLLQHIWMEFSDISDWKLTTNDCGNMPVVVQNVSVLLQWTHISACFWRYWIR